jgi:hypothetical protein
MRAFFVVGLIALLALLAWRPWDAAAAPAAGGGDAAAPQTAGESAQPEHAVPPPASEPVVLTDHKVPRPLHRASGGVPGNRRLVGELPNVDRGIPLPDGRRLPFLNGMTWSPPVQRDAIHGPVPPVVAIVVDAEGFE